MNVGIDSDPATLDPIVESTLGAVNILPSLYDTLLQFNGKGQLVPDLATAWKYLAPTKLRLTLRSGVRYEDGTPFTAAAAKFDLQRQGEATSAYAGFYANIASITATGPTTLVVTFKSPDSSFVDALAGRAGYMVSPAAVRKYGSQFGLHPVGTGAFILSSYTPNSEVVLTRNPHYWQPHHPYLAGLDFHIITNDTTKAVAVASGELQTVDYIESVDAGRVSNASSVALTSWPGTLTPYIPVNFNVAPLNDPKVREALSLAIDRASLVKNVFLNEAQPANSLLAGDYPAYDRALPSTSANVAKAKQLLGGKTVQLTMQVPPTYTEEAQVIQQQLAAAGITLTLQNMDWGTLIDNQKKGSFQLQASDLSGEWPNADFILGGFFTPNGVFNRTHFSDPAITSALKDALATLARSRQAANYAKVQQAAFADNVFIPLVWEKNSRASSAKLHGVPQLPDGTLEFGSAWLG